MRLVAPCGALALLASCTFSPAAPSTQKPNDADASTIVRDGGRPDGGVIPPADGGDAIDAGMTTPDAGFADSGVVVPMPPVVTMAFPGGALPWDTVILSAEDTFDPNGDPLTFEWSVVTPALATSGLGVFPGDDQTTVGGMSAPLYVSEPGDYLVRLNVSDGMFDVTMSATVSVDAFRMLPMSDPGSGESVRVDVATGRAWFGSDNRGLFYADVGDTVATKVPCISTAKINDILLLPNGNVAVSTEDGLEIFDGSQCSAPIQQFSKRRGFFLAANGTDIITVGDPSVYRYQSNQGAFEEPGMDFDAFGDSAKLRGAAIASNGLMWFGSDESPDNDGIAYTMSLPNALAGRVDLFTGDDKIKTIRVGRLGEVWIAGDPGIAYIRDPQLPDNVDRFIAGDGLPPAFNGNVRDVAIAPDDDVWFASQSGIARYKRDVQQMVVIGRGDFGLPSNADLSGIDVDDGEGQRRAIFASGGPGVWFTRAP